jgi:hypothetical protein
MKTIKMFESPHVVSYIVNQRDAGPNYPLSGANYKKP